MWYARSCNGNAKTSGAANAGMSGRVSIAQDPGEASDAPFDRSSGSCGPHGNHFSMFDRFFRRSYPRRDHDDGEIVVDERDRPVLEFSGSIALGVNVVISSLSALQRKRVIGPAADNERVAGRCYLASELTNLRFQFERTRM